MNLLEQYIVEVHSVKPSEADWIGEFPDRTFVDVDLTTNCYGCKDRRVYTWTEKQWADIKEQGYYMG